MSEKNQKDTLFAAPLGQIDGFSFDEQVAAVFPDMLNRSIPGYQAIIAQTGLLTARYAKPNTRCYDLGCSLGATALSMQHNISVDGCEIVAVDNSPAMIDKLSHTIATNHSLTPITLQCEDLAQTDVALASVVALNFTLQFVDPGKRLALLSRIHQGMVDDSVLIVSEKVVFDDPVVNDLYIDMYSDFKRANGYSDLEISQKRTALENVLIPDTVIEHQQRLMEAGFKSSSVWFQCFNFVSLIALK